MPQRPYVIDQMISAKAIAARVEALAREITAHFQGCDKATWTGFEIPDEMARWVRSPCITPV